MRLTFSIERFTPQTDPQPHAEDFRLEVGRGSTVLDCLVRIKNELDGTLAFRYSCRSAICGSCAMTINGSEKLACRTSVRRELERHGQLAIGPLRNAPIIKDLAVDIRPFWEKIRDVTPWISTPPPTEGSSPGDKRQLPGSSYQFHNVDACIMCGACVAACTTHEVSRAFLGPAALAKAERFLADPRETAAAKRARLIELDKDHGMWDCVRCNMCVEVCPKDVKPMEAIVRLRRAALDGGMTQSGGARHITGFSDLVRRSGRLNEALMPMKIIGLNPFRALRVLPLGIKMLLKGKVPNPFGHAIPGLAQVRTIFAAARRRLLSP